MKCRFLISSTSDSVPAVFLYDFFGYTIVAIELCICHYYLILLVSLALAFLLSITRKTIYVVY